MQPKFIFGIKGDVRSNLFFIDDQRILYPSGHNIVIFNVDDKSQQYIPGVEGSEGISALSVSTSRKYLAVCEKADRALCLIYDLGTMKRRKVLSSTDYSTREFISVAFSPQNEKSLLITLTGEPDWMLILWMWDKSKCLSFQRVGISGNQILYQCSFHV